MPSLEPVSSLYKLARADPDPSLDTTETGVGHGSSTSRSLSAWKNLAGVAVDIALKSDLALSLRS